MSTAERDPYLVLGLATDATESELRDRYLELVKAYPPDRDPEKFHEIRAAYETASDPLKLAMRLIEPPSDEEVPEWSDVLTAHAAQPPRLTAAFLLSLGNRGIAASLPAGPEKQD